MNMGPRHVFLILCQVRENFTSQRVIKLTGLFIYHLLDLTREVNSDKLDLYLYSFFTQLTLETVLRTHEYRQSPGHSKQDGPYIDKVADMFGLKGGGDPRLPENLRIYDANKDKL